MQVHSENMLLYFGVAVFVQFDAFCKYHPDVQIVETKRIAPTKRPTDM